VKYSDETIGSVAIDKYRKIVIINISKLTNYHHRCIAKYV